MTERASKLLQEALALSEGERADLASSLLESLEESADASVSAAWQTEILRRMEDVDSGKVVPLTLDEARRKLSSALE